MHAARRSRVAQVLGTRMNAGRAVVRARAAQGMARTLLPARFSRSLVSLSSQLLRREILQDLASGGSRLEFRHSCCDAQMLRAWRASCLSRSVIWMTIPCAACAWQPDRQLSNPCTIPWSVPFSGCQVRGVQCIISCARRTRGRDESLVRPHSCRSTR